jgi:hypothetical protein
MHRHLGHRPCGGTPTTLFGLALAPGFAARAGSFTPSRTHCRRYASLEHAGHASVGSVGDCPSLDMVAASTKTARARARSGFRSDMFASRPVQTWKLRSGHLPRRHAHVSRAEHLDQVSMGSARGLPPLRMAAATCNNEEKAWWQVFFFVVGHRPSIFARRPRRASHPLRLGRPAPQVQWACPFQPGTGRSRRRRAAACGGRLDAQLPGRRDCRHRRRACIVSVRMCAGTPARTLTIARFMRPASARNNAAHARLHACPPP